MEVKKKMNSQELRSLQEAYLEVVENQQLDEGYKIYNNRKVQDKMDKLKSKGDLESVGRAGQIRDKLIKRSFSSQIPDREEKLNRNKSEKYKRSKTVSDNTKKKKSFPNRLSRKDGQGIKDSYDYYDIILSHLLDEDSRRTSNKQQTKRVRSNIKSFGSNYTPPNNYDPDANRGKGEVLTRKQIEKKRRKALRQEEVSVYDIILSHLLDEGYAETQEAAEVIMVNMSEEWRQSIVS